MLSASQRKSGRLSRHVIPLPHPALVATHDTVWIADAGAAPRRVTRAQAVRAATDTPHLLLNAPLTAARLGYPELSGLDLLELFAFVHPARFAVPTAAGLAQALGLAPPSAGADEAAFLARAAAALLATLGRADWSARPARTPPRRRSRGRAGHGRRTSAHASRRRPSPSEGCSIRYRAGKTPPPVRARAR